MVLAAACSVGGTDTAPGAVAGIVVTTNASSNGVFIGDRVQMDAVPVDANSNIVTIPVTFSSGTPSVATITSTGLITAVGAGTDAITVTAGTVQDLITITVDGNVSGSVVVNPATASVRVGGQQQFAVTVATTLGNPARGKTVTWSTSDTTKAGVSTAGVAAALAATPAVSICAVATDVASATGCGTLTITP
jgi:hypothetical protein